MQDKKNAHGLIITHVFSLKDVLQIMIGASILAIPVGFTEETWRLGQLLPLINVIGLLLLSFFFISAFVYYNYHKHQKLEKHLVEFVKRTASTYVFAFIVVAAILTLIQTAPWATNFILALKRVIIVTFPASMSGAIADVLK